MSYGSLAASFMVPPPPVQTVENGKSGSERWLAVCELILDPTSEGLFSVGLFSGKGLSRGEIGEFEILQKKGHKIRGMYSSK